MSVNNVQLMRLQTVCCQCLCKFKELLSSQNVKLLKNLSKFIDYIFKIVCPP